MNIITQLVILTLSLLLSLLLVGANPLNHYTTDLFSVPIKTCCDLRIFPPNRVQSGVYKMNYNLGTFTTTNVYCGMSADGGGGWIVIQRNRINSELSFDKNWREYEDGFGDLNKDFWAGLKLMHTLTQTGQWEMRVDYQQNDKTWSYLHYNQFSAGSASEEYPLTVGGFTGEGTDWFVFHPLNGMKFTTVDNENDKYSGNCAVHWKSGWWYNNCRNINTNTQPPNVGGSVLFTEMKIRPKDCITK